MSRTEPLEARQLLSVQALDVQVGSGVEQQSKVVTLSWQDDDWTSNSSYEIWINQELGTNRRLSKVYYNQTQVSNAEADQALEQLFAPGKYTAYVRGTTDGVKTLWDSARFEVDTDNDSETPIVLNRPVRPQITSHRIGQGAAGQRISEGALSWTGDAPLYNVWLGRVDENGSVTRRSYIRSVPASHISLRELASFSEDTVYTPYADVRRDDTLHQLESGRYVFYVQGLNAAVDSAGNWIGRSSWSRPYRFSFNRVEGSDAIPSSIDATQQSLPVVTWAAVEHAESYLVNIWQGPDYSQHRPVSLRVYCTQFDFAINFEGTGKNVRLAAGDTAYIRVRAIGSEGMLEGLRQGNFASTVVFVPDVVELTPPEIVSPQSVVHYQNPILRWSAIPNVQSYDVWLGSRQSHQRIALIENVRDTTLVLDSSQFIDEIEDASFSRGNGLISGPYSVWVRARGAAGEEGPWSSRKDFSVDTGPGSGITYVEKQLQQAFPLVSPNLILPYTQDGVESYLVTNGLVESFGASVLARYVLLENGEPSRPLIDTASTTSGSSRLQYPDISVGSNVADMAFLSDHGLVVLSRSSNEVHLIDVANWKLLSTLQLAPGALGSAPDAMDLEVLSDKQILVVFNRSSRLRVLGVDDQKQLYEVRLADATDDQEGIYLSSGRAVQVSAFALSDTRHRLFFATPSVSGVVVAEYDSAVGSLTYPNVISRSPFATPYVGGVVVSLYDEMDTEHHFYISTDRNGFATWVNTNTLASGFIDLVDFIPDSTRDPTSDLRYRAPNDNSVDPTRVIQVDRNHLAFFNNRDSSVLLSSETTTSGEMVALSGTPFDMGYGGIAIEADNGFTILQTSGGTAEIFVGTHQLVKTRFATTESGDLRPIPAEYYALADPIDDATVLSKDTIVLKYAGRRAILEWIESGSRWVKSDLPTQFTAEDGIVYTDAFGALAAFSSEDGTEYLAIAVRPDNLASSESGIFAIVDVTDPVSPRLYATFEVPKDLLPHRVYLDGETLRILDRLQARAYTISDWQTSPVESEYHFSDRLPQNFGSSRSGAFVQLTDGTSVFLHDTHPDRVFSVFTGDRSFDQQVAQVTSHIHGQWIADFHVLDEDRVIAVTWDANAIILNVRSGIVEKTQQLHIFQDKTLDLYGTRSTDFKDGILSVSSPATGTVANYHVNSETLAIDFIDTVTAPDIVTTLVSSTGVWVVETGRINRRDRRLMKW